MTPGTQKLDSRGLEGCRWQLYSRIVDVGNNCDAGHPGNAATRRRWSSVRTSPADVMTGSPAGRVTAMDSPAAFADSSARDLAGAASGQPPHASKKNSFLGPPPFPCTTSVGRSDPMLNAFSHADCSGPDVLARRRSPQQRADLLCGARRSRSGSRVHPRRGPRPVARRCLLLSCHDRRTVRLSGSGAPVGEVQGVGVVAPLESQVPAPRFRQVDDGGTGSAVHHPRDGG